MSVFAPGPGEAPVSCGRTRPPRLTGIRRPGSVSFIRWSSSPQRTASTGEGAMNEARIEKEDVLRVLREHRSELENLGVRRIGLFGSVVRGGAGPDSDVDVLVEFTTGDKNYSNFIRLSFLLEEIFERPVELVTVDGLSSHLGPRILEETEFVPLTG